MYLSGSHQSSWVWDIPSHPARFEDEEHDGAGDYVFTAVMIFAGLQTVVPNAGEPSLLAMYHSRLMQK